MLEYPVDTTRAALNLMLTGTLERFGRIRFILAHAGGTLPFLLPRFAGAAQVDPRLPHVTEEMVAACLRRFFYEIAQASGASSLAALGKVTALDHILLGTDFPYCGENAIASMAANIGHLSGGREALRLAGAALFAEATGALRSAG
jgi:predicted TIM-barrel fold metal-dependent hydrolase